MESSPKPDRELMLINGAENTVDILKRNRDKGCRAAVEYLFQLRREINERRPIIKNVDDDFIKFYQAGNSSEEYWIGLVSLLKRGGYSKIDIQSVFMDLIGVTYAQDKTVERNNAQKAVLTLMNLAVDFVFSN